MQSKSLWEQLWDYDPNGLIVLDRNLRVQIVNPAFCRLFGTKAEAIIGEYAASFLDDVTEFREAWERHIVIPSHEHYYPKYRIYVRKVIFTIPDQEIIACIMVDLTHEHQQREELLRLKRETIEKVSEVVDNQMKVAQEIAGLLGETTAETKITLLRLREIVEQDIV